MATTPNHLNSEKNGLRQVAPRAELTDRKIAQAKKELKPYKLADGNGLFLAVTPTGSKLWRWKYRVNKQEKLMALGSYPTVTLMMARQARDAARRALFENRDPMEDRKVEKLARQFAVENSFQNVAKKWWDHWNRPPLSARHAEQAWRRFEKDVFPYLGNRPISDIQASEIRRVMMMMAERGAIEKAKKVFWTIGMVFRYAVGQSLIKTNVAREIIPKDTLPSREVVNHARVLPNRLPLLLRQIDAYDSTPTRLAMKLLAMTFVRTSELIQAPWEEFDLDKAMWVIPGVRMKRRTDHKVPLSTQAVEILRTLQTLSGNSKLLFPGQRDHDKPMSNNTILMALKRMGFKGEMTGHGFRGIASTYFYEHGFQREHIELQLAHVERNKTVAAYNHAEYMDSRVVMMQIWSDHLDAVRHGKLQSVSKLAA